jgi:Uma2 family endonuclease
MAISARLTLEEFLALEETKPYLEYACGEAFEKPMPNRLHAVVQRYLILVLAPFLDSTGLGEVFPEFRCIFGPPGRERAYVPDLTVVTRERLTADLYLRTAPDLAIEVLSPDQHTARFLDKVQFYLLNGVRLVWVIDPLKDTVAVLVPGQEVRILYPGDVLDGGDVLPGFRVPIDDLFAATRV